MAASGRTAYTCRGEDKVLPFKAWAGLILEGRGRHLGLGLPRFGLLHPWSVRHDASLGLCLNLLSNAFQWEQGFAVEREFILSLGAGSSRNKSLAASGPVRAAAFGLAGLKAILPFSPPGEGLESDPLFGLYLEVGAGLCNALKQEQARWDGIRDFGDYRMPFGHFANCEFDPAYGLLKRFLLTGVLNDLAQAEAMLKHWHRYDCTGPDDEKFPEGLPWVHGPDHMSGRIEAGHMWVDGALLFGLLTGEKAWTHSACTMGRYLVGSGPGEGDQLRERCAAWSLLALCALDEAGMPGFTEAMNRFAAAIRRRQTKTGYFRFHRSEEGTVPVYKVNAWVTAGITLEGLYRHFHQTLDPRSLEAVIRAASWLDRACLDPNSGRWYQNLCYRADRDGSLVNRQGKVTGEDAAFLALGLARAGYLSGEQRFLNLARCALDEGLRRIKSRPPRYPGRALSVILRTAPDVILTTRAMQNRR